jgi:hypothetical protein
MLIRITLLCLVPLMIVSSADAQSITASRSLEQAIARSAEHRNTAPPPQFQQRDSRRNGFLIGLVAGAIPGVLAGMGIKRYCENEARDCSSAVPIVGVLGGAVGGLIGAAVDDAIGNSISDSRPRPPAGVRFSIRF